MGMFDFLAGGNPSSAANKYLKQVPGTIKPYYDPYIEAGNKALPNLEEQYGRLISDPAALYAELGKGYQTSPGYDFALQQALGAAGNAASAGGMAGSPMHEQQTMDVASGMASRDFDRYMNDVMGLYGTGLSGEQGLYQTGFNASDTLAKMLAENLRSQGSNAAGGKQFSGNMNLGMLGVAAGMLPYLFM